MRLPNRKFDQNCSWIALLTFDHRQTDRHDARDVLFRYNTSDKQLHYSRFPLKILLAKLIIRSTVNFK
jgi:hypothetical protein